MYMYLVEHTLLTVSNFQQSLPDFNWLNGNRWSSIIEQFQLVSSLLVFFGSYAYQQYFSYSTSTVHKSMFPGLIFNQYSTSPLSWNWKGSRNAFPIILSTKGEASTTSFKDYGLLQPGIEPTTSRSQGGRFNH